MRHFYSALQRVVARSETMPTAAAGRGVPLKSGSAFRAVALCATLVRMCCTGQLCLLDLGDICLLVSNKTLAPRGVVLFCFCQHCWMMALSGHPPPLASFVFLSAPSMSLIERSMGAKNEKQCRVMPETCPPFLLTFVSSGGSSLVSVRP